MDEMLEVECFRCGDEWSVPQSECKWDEALEEYIWYCPDCVEYPDYDEEDGE